MATPTVVVATVTRTDGRSTVYATSPDTAGVYEVSATTVMLGGETMLPGDRVVLVQSQPGRWMALGRVDANLGDGPPSAARWRGVWDPAASYLPGDLVFYDGSAWMCGGPGTATGLTVRGSWDTAASYTDGDVVGYGGSGWLAVSGMRQRSGWVGSSGYTPGDVVEFGGSTWAALTSAVGPDAFDLLDFDLVASSDAVTAVGRVGLVETGSAADAGSRGASVSASDTGSGVDAKTLLAVVQSVAETVAGADAVKAAARSDRDLLGGADAVGGTRTVMLGAFSGLTDLGLDDSASLAYREAQIGRTYVIASHYYNMTDVWPGRYEADDRAAGRIPMISWYGVQLSKITSGSMDYKIDARAANVAADGRLFYIRWGLEMNGDWYSFSGAKNGHNPAAFIAAWQRIHDRFMAAGATNVQWVWAPNYESQPDPVANPWNAVQNYYPGDAYVDWVGIDGYNFGATWMSAEEIFTPVVNMYAGRKPIMLAEWGCNEAGGSKAQWTADAAAWIGRTPSIKAVAFYDHLGSTLDTSPAAWQSYLDNFVNNPLFGGSAQPVAPAPVIVQGIPTSPVPTGTVLGVSYIDTTGGKATLVVPDSVTVSSGTWAVDTTTGKVVEWTTAGTSGTATISAVFGGQQVNSVIACCPAPTTTLTGVPTSGTYTMPTGAFLAGSVIAVNGSLTVDFSGCTVVGNGTGYLFALTDSDSLTITGAGLIANMSWVNLGGTTPLGPGVTVSVSDLVGVGNPGLVFDNSQDGPMTVTLTGVSAYRNGSGVRGVVAACNINGWSALWGGAKPPSGNAAACHALDDNADTVRATGTYVHVNQVVGGKYWYGDSGSFPQGDFLVCETRNETFLIENSTTGWNADSACVDSKSAGVVHNNTIVSVGDRAIGAHYSHSGDYVLSYGNTISQVAVSVADGTTSGRVYSASGTLVAYGGTGGDVLTLQSGAYVADAEVVYGVQSGPPSTYPRVGNIALHSIVPTTPIKTGGSHSLMGVITQDNAVGP